MSFQISALSKSQFEHLFALPDSQLTDFQAVRMIASEKPGFPCRVSLADAEVGEEMILVHFEHHSVDTPFRASHAIFVRPGAVGACPKPGEVPQVLRSRMLPLRGFDAAGMLITADLADGRTLDSCVEEMIQDSNVSYIHIHFAKPGCYAARVDRPGSPL